MRGIRPPALFELRAQEEWGGGVMDCWIIGETSALFEQLFVSMHHSHAAFHLRLRRETFATFAGDFEVGFVPFMRVLFHTASKVEGCGGLWFVKYLLDIRGSAMYSVEHET